MRLVFTRLINKMTAKYIKNFVAGHGIQFQMNKRNQEAFEAAQEKWSEIEANLEIEPNSVVIFCGAKNNGKSSLLRFLVNKYIQKTNSYAYYVDFDPGQSEMATPGTVSAHMIRSPLESPTYLNILQHEPVAMSSIGGINMSVNPKLYIQNCRFIFSRVKEQQSKQSEKRPIFVNTMGFIRNVGLAMLMDLIKICKPTDLVVLNVDSDPMRTIYADLSPNQINNTRASFYYETMTNQSTELLDYKYHLHNLQFAFSESSSIATKNRAASQLAYFGTIPDALYKPIMQLTPKWISFNSVSIYCVSSYPLKEQIVLELLYHSWIHLVKIKKSTIANQSENDARRRPDNSSICRIIDDVGENLMFGCGIVADIDLDSMRLAIITPLSQECLDKDVDCIIKPLSVQVPQELALG